MTTLKEETIRGIKTEGAFDMENFGIFDHIVKITKRIFGKSCGTPVCMAGHIVAAQKRLGRTIPNPSDLSCDKSEKKGLRYDFHPVARVARHLWAKSYGVPEANRLEFTAFGWGEALEQVTPEEAVAHLNGANPVFHDD